MGDEMSWNRVAVGKGLQREYLPRPTVDWIEPSSGSYSLDFDFVLNPAGRQREENP